MTKSDLQYSDHERRLRMLVYKRLAFLVPGIRITSLDIDYTHDDTQGCYVFLAEWYHVPGNFVRASVTQGRLMPAWHSDNTEELDLLVCEMAGNLAVRAGHYRYDTLPR